MSSDATLSAETSGFGTWRPIETAPHEGSVLLYTEETGEQFIAFYGICPDDDDRQWISARDMAAGVTFVVRSPSHWMPLPPPPADCDGPRSDESEA